MSDPRVRALRLRLRELADEEHAAFHRAYHKSELAFHGLRTPALRAVLRQVFPARPRLERQDVLGLVDELWPGRWFEERSAALWLLGRTARELGPADLPRLRRMTRDCQGWAHLDELAVNVLGPLALAHGDAVYEPVRAWTRDRHLWMRRAAVLIHVRPARVGKLDATRAWSTFEELLPERDFFLRKAVGWALRECCRHYPREVHAFLLEAGERASGLTRREGARKLPPRLRRQLLGR